MNGATVAAAANVIVRETPSECGTKVTMDCTSSGKWYVWMLTDWYGTYRIAIDGVVASAHGIEVK